MERVNIPITVDELAQWDETWVEVIDGVLVEVDTDTMGLKHTIIIHNLYDLIRPFVKTNQLGYFHGDGLKYILATDEQGHVIAARTPDLAFIRRGNIPTEFDRNRPYPGAPDLAIEVASPGQASTELLDKVGDFLKYGVEEVWMIYPSRQEVHRHRKDEQAPLVYRAGETMEVPQFFAGLKIAIADLFIDDAV